MQGFSESSPVFLQSSSSEEVGVQLGPLISLFANKDNLSMQLLDGLQQSMLHLEFLRTVGQSKKLKMLGWQNLPEAVREGKRMCLVALKHLGPKILLLTWMIWGLFQENIETRVSKSFETLTNFTKSESENQASNVLTLSLFSKNLKKRQSLYTMLNEEMAIKNMLVESGESDSNHTLIV